MSTVTDEQIITVECLGGHTYEAPKRSGRPPKYCDDHKRFHIQPLSNRLKPPTRVRQEWAEQGKMLDDDEYEERWMRLWTETVRRLGAMGNSWNAVDTDDLDKIERFVRSSRLAELHRLMAQDSPYITSAHGSVKAHPGWELAEREDARVTKLAGELGINPVAEEKKKTETKAPGYKTRLEQSANDHPAIAPPMGPDGLAL